MHTSLGKSIYSQSLIVKTLYNKAELDKLRDDIKKQIVDPGIQKLEASLASIKSYVTSLRSSVAATKSYLTLAKDSVTSLSSSVADVMSSLNSAKGTLTSIQSSMDHEKTKLENLKRQVNGTYSESSRTSKIDTILRK